MNWQTTYPTLAQVNEASFDTLNTWLGCLPPPQTDVERTIMRRLRVAHHAQAAKSLREVSPDLADKFKDLGQRLRACGIQNPFENY